MLIEAGATLPERSRRQVLAAGPDAVPALIEVLVDEALDRDDGPGGGYARSHAAKLLGELAAAEAALPMLNVLVGTEWLTILHDTLLLSLPSLGAAVVEPALRLYAESADADARKSLVAVLAEAGVRDQRIFNLLLEALLSDPERGAGLLAAYGDPAAIVWLHDALDRQRVENTGGPLANQVFIELHAAIEELGGTVTQAEKEKVARAMQVRDRALAELQERKAEGRLPVRSSPKRGRNETCWCGSGKKYKKCHLASDEETVQ